MAKNTGLTINSVLMMSITIFFIAIIITMTFISFSETDKDLKSMYHKEQLSAEDLFNKSSIYIHRAYKLWDKTYNPPMEKSIQIVSDAYNNSGKNPDIMDLDAIQEIIFFQTGFYMNVYLINESGIVTHTTDVSEKNMDFSIYPEFFSRLNSIRHNSEFIPDEIVVGFISNAPHTKFAYQPTSDHRYIIQLGINVENEYLQEKKYLSYETLVSHVKGEYPTITKVHLINSLLNPEIGEDDYQGKILDPFTNKTASDVFRNKFRVEIEDEKNHTSTSYFYIPHNVDKSPSSMYQDLVGKIIFSTQARDADLTHNLVVHLILGLSGTFAAILVGWIISRRISTPITRIVEEIDQIAGGDLSGEISPSFHPELNRIADAIRSMVRHIRAIIQDLEESESKYRSLFESSSDAILIIDKEIIKQVNPAAIVLLAGHQGDITGNKIQDICEPIGDFIKEQEFVEPENTRSSEGIARLSIPETEISTDINGELRYLNIRLSPVYDRSGLMIQTRIHDVTASHNLQEAIRKQNSTLEEQVLERTQTLQTTIEDLNAFTYSISHDLRAPLRRMYSDIYILNQKIPESLESSHYFERIKDNLKYMDDLIKDLLQFSQTSRQTLIKTNLDMNDLVNGVITDLQDLIKNKQIIIWIDEIPHANGDYTLIRQVFYNLISNAVKFSHPDRQNEIRISSVIENGLIHYVISDTGIGFNNEYKDKVFQVFFRLPQNGEFEGTGVGLAIVKRIINRHGGWITAESEEGVGSKFSFFL